MTVPQKRRTGNIRRSINKFIKDEFETPNSLGGKIKYADQTFDFSGKDQWVVLNYLSDGAGKKDATLLQIDIYSRVGGRRSGSDRYGAKLQELGEKLHDALHVRDIQIYDYSADETSPTAITNAKLIVRNSDGKFGEPEETQEFEPENDVMRKAYTYRLITLGEASQASMYY